MRRWQIEATPVRDDVQSEGERMRISSGGNASKVLRDLFTYPFSGGAFEFAFIPYLHNSFQILPPLRLPRRSTVEPRIIMKYEMKRLILQQN